MNDATVDNGFGVSAFLRTFTILPPFFLMRFFTLLLLLVVLILPVSALAQGPANLESLHVALWPEFDDPRLLVILDGVLSQAGATVRVPIPDGADLNAVATADAAGGFLNAAYETQASADGQIVVLTPQNQAFRIEYYAPLPISDGQRRVSFSLPAGYLAAKTVSIEALTPPDAANVAAEPSMQSGGAGTGGGQVFLRQIDDAADQDISQEVSYSNPAGALTVSETARATTAPTPTPAPATPKPADSTTRLPLLLGLGLIAILLIVAGGYGIWRTRQPAAAPTPPPARPAADSGKPIDRAPGKPPAPSSSSAAAGQDRFCRQCGAEFQRNDRFCRACGATRQ